MNFLLIVAALTWCSGLLINEQCLVSASGSYYERIHDHLVQEVQSEDPEANMAELRRWFGAKRTFMNKNSGVWEVIDSFIKMVELFSHYTQCNEEDYKVLSHNAKAMTKVMGREERANYPLLRVDMLMQHYFYKYGMLCADTVFGFKVPHEADYGWKRWAYLSVNTYVLDHDDHPSTATTLRLVRNYLKELEKEQMDGSVTAAARQFLAMETRVLGVDRCTYKAYEVIKANELAVSEYDNNPRFPRFLQAAFKDLVLQHASMCQPIYQEKLQSKLKHLNQETFRSVSILANEYFLLHFYNSHWRPVVSGIDHKQYKQINPDMTTPQIIELMTRLSNTPDFEVDDRRLRPRDRIAIDELFPQNLRVFIETTNNPNYKGMDVSKNMIGLKQLFRQYVMEPCREYKAEMEELLLPSLYNSYQSYEISSAPKDRLLDNLSLRLGQVAYQLCKKAALIEEDYLDEYIEQAITIDQNRL